MLSTHSGGVERASDVANRGKRGARLTALRGLLWVAAFACLSACATVAPPPPAPPLRALAVAEAGRARRPLAAPPSLADATADRGWCRRACRHLRGLASMAEEPLDECTATCQRWGSGDRIRCILESESLDEVDRCAW